MGTLETSAKKLDIGWIHAHELKIHFLYHPLIILQLELVATRTSSSSKPYSSHQLNMNLKNQQLPVPR